MNYDPLALVDKVREENKFDMDAMTKTVRWHAERGLDAQLKIVGISLALGFAAIGFVVSYMLAEGRSFEGALKEWFMLIGGALVVFSCVCGLYSLQYHMSDCTDKLVQAAAHLQHITTEYCRTTVNYFGMTGQQDAAEQCLADLPASTPDVDDAQAQTKNWGSSLFKWQCRFLIFGMLF